MKKLMKNTRSLATQTAMVLTLVAVMYFAAGLAGCRATADSVHLLDGDFVAPALQDFAPRDSANFTLRFSKPVTLSAVEIREMETNILCGEATREPDEDPLAVTLQLASPTTLGVRYWMNGIVTDKSGNSLDFSVGFTGYNDRVPALLLSEVRSEKGTKSVNKVSIPQVAYMELYALSAGNLAGVQLFNSYSGIEKTFEFPVCEVRKGEYIVVHFGKNTEFSKTEVDEVGSKLNLAVGNNTTPSRDFYVADDDRRFHKTDIVFLRERAGGKLMDVLLTNGAAKTTWDAKWVLAVNEASESGLWPNATDIATAKDSSKVTTTRTLSRQNIASAQAAVNAGKTAETFTPQGRASWLVTKASSASPGERNSTEPYVAPAKK
jgi:hypothetical protein